MDFSEALSNCKQGTKVSRMSWFSGQYVVYRAALPRGIEINEDIAEALGKQAGEIVKFNPYLLLMTSEGICVPWSASTGDLLADDWIATM